MVPGMLDPEMIEDTAKIVNKALNYRHRANLIINNRAGGNAPSDRREDSGSAAFGKTAKTFLTPLISTIFFQNSSFWPVFRLQY